MRLRHVLLTCAALPLSVPAGAAEKTIPTAQQVSDSEVAATRASVAKFIKQVDIPYTAFTLPNGLRVLVHTDHSAPLINVSVWYDVGSKHEPAGRSGFAHLFEHLMFNGSENVPGEYLKPLMEIGADVNGSTTADRTSYYETVPTQALDRALFMESDRMGHLLGALDQATLDEQRGVVQNEKRQSDDKPGSIIGYMSRAALYPTDHPYGHSVIGSMKDLNAADLSDVRQWFKAHYGPNNATLILAGDIDPETAKRLVTKYFGGIPAGPRNVRPSAGPVPMPQTISETVTAPLTSAVIVRTWPVPGADSKDSLALDGVMEVLAGGDDNVLNRHLVREKKLFQQINANNSTSAQAGEFSIGGTVRPGVDPKVAAAALDAEIETFLHSTPSEDAVARFVARFTYRFVHQLEQVTSRGRILGDYLIAHGNPDAYKSDLQFYTGLTPASVMTAARRWLERPRYELTVLPGPRVTPKDDAGMDGAAPKAEPDAPASSASPVVASAEVARKPLPPVGPPMDPRFPKVEHARLSNGIPIIYARYTGAPFTAVGMDIKGGTLMEPQSQTGTMAMMYSMLDEGSNGRDEHWIAQRKERLGLVLSAGAGSESGDVALDAPDTNLGAGLEMMRQMLTAPDFSQETLDRHKREQLDRLASIRLNPSVLMAQVMAPRVNAGSPYNRLTMYGDPKAIRKIDRAGVEASFKRWIRPEYAYMRVVSDQPLSALMPLLERTIGTWKVAGEALPIPAVDYSPQAATPQIVLVDLPGAVQATVEGSQTIPIGDREPDEALELANQVLGGTFTSRINMNIREQKHWSYGAYGSARRRPYGSQYTVSATIQQDKVGPAIAEMMKDLDETGNSRPITPEEFDRAKASALGKAASQYADRYAVVGAIDDIRRFQRSDDYPAGLSQRYRGVTLGEANAMLRSQIRPGQWVWGIVGNAAIIRPQLDKLGLPVTVVKPEEVLPPL